jgi:hypothetical protein
VPFPHQSKEQKLPSQLAVSSAPLFGGSAAGDARQARNISSYTKTTQQRENGPSVPWVLTKFRGDSSRTRQSLLIPSALFGSSLSVLHRARAVRLQRLSCCAASSAAGTLPVCRYLREAHNNSARQQSLPSTNRNAAQGCDSCGDSIPPLLSGVIRYRIKSSRSPILSPSRFIFRAKP